jgi:hypothetical protein
MYLNCVKVRENCWFTCAIKVLSSAGRGKFHTKDVKISHVTSLSCF